jgi:hypothetical protein
MKIKFKTKENITIEAEVQSIEIEKINTKYYIEDKIISISIEQKNGTLCVIPIGKNSIELI